MRASSFLAGLLLTSIIFLAPGGAHAFMKVFHQSITGEELRKLGFDSESAAAVRAGNRYVDDHLMDWAPGHFDSEAFAAGSAKLRERLATIVTAISVCDRKGALHELGMATHAVQDFFAHSNFVEIRQKNGMAAPDLLNLADPPSTLACNSSSFTGGLTSGYWPDRATPKRKCSHYRLNKDNPLRNTLFGKAWHEMAKDWARAATRDFVAAVKNELNRKYPPRISNLMFELLKAEPSSLDAYRQAGLCR